LVALGFFLSSLWALTLSGILPAVSTVTNTTEIGPKGTVIFVVFTAYAIIKHKLFDIRIIVARSMAYFLALAVLVIVFAIGAFSLTSHVAQTDAGLRLSYTILAIVLALIFTPIKRTFDKMTNTVFYQDAYDTQAFLDQLNKTILDNIELSHLLRSAAAVIERNLKSREVTFLIYDHDAEINMAISSSRIIRYVEHQKVLDMLIATKKNLLVFQFEHDKKLLNVMEENNIAVAANLHSLHHTKSSAKSFMLLGEKKSGNPYNEDDLKVIQIIADELVIAIQNSLRFEEIQSFNETLQQRVADATRNLRRANDKLKTLDETKDDFISMASHQLRTPLTSIKGYLSMMLEGDAGELTKTQKDMVSQSFISAQRMVYLISDMLNVSRLKTGKFAIESSPVNLADVVEQELEQVKETAASRGLTIEYRKPDNFPSLVLDETKMRQVIMNFADNAIYYTPHGGHIEVKLINKEHTIDLKVIDDGIGVPASEKHHLFTKFYRAKNSRAARPDGTGLGLYMAQKIIVAQGGAIIFDSTEGKGSTFGFTFSKTKLKPPEKSPEREAAAVS
jgi:signal transduction histidine kinase